MERKKNKLSGKRKEPNATLKKNLPKDVLKKSEQNAQKKNMSSKKLHDKTNKIRRGDDDVSLLQKRYYHISIDKLGDAFEKQFMQNLPDFGQYALDPNLSQEEIKNKKK